MTASDEPDGRKRARIRLELAVGYFEQGQTAVALDELKQSLVADPAYAPGTGTPEVGGFSSRELLQYVLGLRPLHLVGFDIVEVSPPYDHGDITAVLAANLAFEFLSLLALRRKNA